ncbi:unnamed protein product [Pleuronectes platessa]|uniref:Uncharacterized protein n=1 Tax=Pleuronectes platessa TaxID=8262 RepID=A0A9N7Z0T9_PLEPL|nr:unnamed protein product [Pleuronectes platessa]
MSPCGLSSQPSQKRASDWTHDSSHEVFKSVSTPEMKETDAEKKFCLGRNGFLRNERKCLSLVDGASLSVLVLLQTMNSSVSQAVDAQTCRPLVLRHQVLKM